MAINWNLGPTGGETGNALASGIDRFGASILEAMKYREQKARQEQLDKQAREHQMFLEQNATDQLGLQKDKWAKEQDQTKLQEENRLRTAQMSQVNPLLDSGDEQGAIRAAQTLGIGADRTQNVTSAVPTKDIDEALGGYTGNIATPSDTIKFRVGNKELTSFNRDESYKKYSEEAGALADSYSRAAEDPGMSSDPIAVAANTYTAAAVRAAAADPRSQFMSGDDLQKFAKAKQDEYFKFDSATQARLLAKAKLEESRRASYESTLRTRLLMGQRDDFQTDKINAQDDRVTLMYDKAMTDKYKASPMYKEVKPEESFDLALQNLENIKADLNSGDKQKALEAATAWPTAVRNFALAYNKGPLTDRDVSDIDPAYQGGFMQELRNKIKRFTGLTTDPKTLDAFIATITSGRDFVRKVSDTATSRAIASEMDKVERGDITPRQARAALASYSTLMGERANLSAINNGMELLDKWEKGHQKAPRASSRKASIDTFTRTKGALRPAPAQAAPALDDSFEKMFEGL